MIASKRFVVYLLGAVMAISLSACGPGSITDYSDTSNSFYDELTGLRVTWRCQGPNMVYLAHSQSGSAGSISVVRDERCKA